MRLAASSIAWNATDDNTVARMLVDGGFTGVELAPTKWREEPYAAPDADVRALRQQWRDRGLEVVALQALLFGRPELQLFGSDESRASLGAQLRSVIDFAARVGASALVFGSPRNRARGERSLEHALEVAIPFFREIGGYAADNGCVLCIEPNPPEYGCDFLTTTTDAIAFCRAVASEGVALNLDAGTLSMNGEDVETIVRDARGLIGHVHASEPRLVELMSDGRHERLAAALNESGYTRWVSVETLPPDPADLSSLQRSLIVAASAYR